MTDQLDQFRDKFMPDTGKPLAQQELFEGYGTPTPSRKKRAPVTLPTEPLAPGWVTVRNTHGVYPFSHRVKVHLPLSGMVTLCGLKGSALSNIGVDYMVRCPSCDIAEQLS